MTITLKSLDEIQRMREGGKRLAHVLHELKEATHSGVVSSELDERARVLFEESGGTPAFYNYAPRGSKRGFPARVCVSVNEVVVHGIPTENPHTFQEGDVVTIDAGLVYDGLITDSAITFTVGEAAPEVRALISATRSALQAGIDAAQPGGHVGDIGAAIQKVVAATDYGNVVSFGGHGVGHHVHESPLVPNKSTAGTGERLDSGLVIAIEPMFTLGSGEIECSDDQFTVRTVDGSLSAHCEHTVAITDDGPKVLTAGVEE